MGLLPDVDPGGQSRPPRGERCAVCHSVDITVSHQANCSHWFCGKRRVCPPPFPSLFLLRLPATLPRPSAFAPGLARRRRARLIWVLDSAIREVSGTIHLEAEIRERKQLAGLGRDRGQGRPLPRPSCQIGSAIHISGAWVLRCWPLAALKVFHATQC